MRAPRTLAAAAALLALATAAAAQAPVVPVPPEPPAQPPTQAQPAAQPPAAPTGAAEAPASAVTGTVDITADEAFEWHEDSQAIVARGNVVATRGEVTMRADTLTAYYRKLPQGGNEVYRLGVEGNVEIRSPKQQAYGDRGVYDVDKEVAVLTGDNLRLVTETDTVTAKDALEYWRGRNLIVARGDAVAVRGDNRVRADQLVGLLQENAEGQLEMTRIDAQGAVVISTPKEVARGAAGTYDVKGQLATLNGDVKVTRGQSQLNGSAAEVNLATGVSRMLAGQQQGGQGRVRGLFVPGQEIGPRKQPATGGAKPGATPGGSKP
ncbi:MAG TPA: LptA/OstA family protein [Azospirillaceae bacterium]|nr:LptA/OstA family protein [Azospirillaceae bacterium]